MATYNELIAQLEAELRKIDESASTLLGDLGNSYRQCAEYLCKALLTAAELPIPTKLDAMISEVHKVVGTRESGRDAGILKTELRYLQGIGNTFSHAGASATSGLDDSSPAHQSMMRALRIAFFGNGELDAPTLPESFRIGIPLRALQRGVDENLRPEEVVRIWTPNGDVSTKLQRHDHSSKLVYDYVESASGGLVVGVFFLRARTSIEKSIVDFFDFIKGGLPNSIFFITPRVFRTDGRPQDRRGSIEGIIASRFAKDLAGIPHKVEYFDEFVWNNCLPARVRNYTPLAAPLPNVIPQSVQLSSRAPGGSETVLAKKYVDRLLDDASSSNPVQVIIGPAGIGKTTFCDGLGLHISARPRRRVVLLSATDFRDVTSPPPVRSVSDLYALAIDQGFTDDEEFIDSHNFEINLGCGNFVLIIDGFDELESHLGEALDFEAFMSSLTELEASFRNVLVILTVRDYDKERFLNFQFASIVNLRGFGRAETETYLKQELVESQVSDARKLLNSFSVDGDPDPQTVPLYASLIRDFIKERANSASAPPPSAAAKLFSIDNPLDRLIKKIIDREIAKQSLGVISADDFFYILIEVIAAPASGLSKGAMERLVDSCGGKASAVSAANFMRNPFLHYSGGMVRFRYDSLSYFFKSRLLARRMQDGQFRPSPSIEFMAEMYRGDGPLFDELKKAYPARIHGREESVTRWFSSLLAQFRQQEGSLEWRRAISGFLYWLTESSRDRAERTELLCLVFSGKVWEAFSVFGKFYSLDLKGVEVIDGHIDGFEALGASDLDDGKVVFFDSYVSFDERSLPPKLDREIFDSSCMLSVNMEAAFVAREKATDHSYEVVKDNIYKLLKVGFRANRFSWKSEAMFKKASVFGMHSRDVYMRALVERGVLREELGKPSSTKGYCVSDAWKSHARKLVEEGNVTMEMGALISHLSS